MKKCTHPWRRYLPREEMKARLLAELKRRWYALLRWPK